jgi:uncharacterized protein (TIGR02001 family)
MSKFLLAVALLVASLAAQAEVTLPYVGKTDLSANVTGTTDYRFRGISQTQNSVALQGGVDVTTESGFYIGNWNSSVSSQVYTNGSGIENDIYGGWKKDIYKGVVVDVGSYNYFYPRTGYSFDTYELYAAVSYGPVTARYNYALNEYFGASNSDGSQYYQVDVNYALPAYSKVAVVGHIGRTEVVAHDKSDYTDWNVGATYDLSHGWNAGARYYWNTGVSALGQAANTVNGQNLTKDQLVVSITKVF